MSAPPSLNLVYEQIKSRMDVQNDQITSLDGKANFSLTSASLLTTAAVALHTDTKDITTFPDYLILGYTFNALDIINTLLIFIFITYLFMIFTAYKGYQVRDYKVIPDPHALLVDYLDKTEAETKEVVTRTMVEAFSINEKLINKKAEWTIWGLRSLVVEAVLLLLTVTIQFVIL
jgi:hypothetical protein